MATLDLSTLNREIERKVNETVRDGIDGLVENYATVANIATADKHILDSFAEWIKNELECEVEDVQ